MAVWKLEKPSPAEILRALDGASTKEERVERLTRLGLSKEQADVALRRAGHAVGPGANLESRPGWRAYAIALVSTCILVVVGVAVLLQLISSL